MHHGLARSFDASRTIHERVLGKGLGAEFDRGLQPFGGRRIPLRDVIEDGGGVVPRASAPDQPQHDFFCFALSMIARISAITSSCGTGGLGSASDAATFRFSHAK